MSADEQLTRALGTIPSLNFGYIGTFVASVDGLAVVDVDGNRIHVPNIGTYPPTPNERVRLIQVDKQTFLWGPVENKSPIGVVAALGSPLMTVEYPPGSGVTAEVPVALNGWTPTVGDLVSLDWDAYGVAHHISGVPTFLAPPDPGGGTGGSRREKFTANDSGSYGSNWFTKSVYDSESNLGAWFYGTKIADTIPDTATITSVKIYLPLQSGSFGNPVLRAHNASAMGSLDFTGPTSALAGKSGWVDVSTAIGDILKVNPYGVGFQPDTGGYNIFRGVDRDADSGALDIAWTY